MAKRMFLRNSILVFLFLIMGCASCEKKPLKVAFLHAEQTLPKEGVLVQKPGGYAYVKVDDRYIHELFPFLKDEEGFKKPPYFRRPDAPGAHISVIYEDEGVLLKEVGQTIHFTLDDIKVVRPRRNISYIIIEVQAPELEQIRKKYGLKPKLKKHEFHISIAKKVEPKPRRKAK